MVEPGGEMLFCGEHARPLLVTRELLLNLVDEAESRGYNQTLFGWAGAEAAVPAGWRAALVPCLMHVDVAGVEQPVENWQVRCLVYTGSGSGADAEVEQVGLLDVNVRLWEAMRGAAAMDAARLN